MRLRPQNLCSAKNGVAELLRNVMVYRLEDGTTLVMTSELIKVSSHGASEIMT